MSIYAQAVQSGVSSLQLMATGENAATKAAYNQAYQIASKRINIAEAKHTAELNVSAIEQDKVLSNTHIRLQQDQAEANAIVNAAVAGVEGGSVDDVLYDTERNEAMAIHANKQRTEQQKEQQLAVIGTQQSALLSIEEPDIDYFGNLLQAFSSFELDDTDISEALSNKK